MTKDMNTQTVETALRRLGEKLDPGREVEILLVGGAAGMVTGLLSPDRVTTDCDVMAYLPVDAMAAVESAAEEVAGELDLASDWLNSNVQMRLDALPDEWETRKQWVNRYGPLNVCAASRIDLIAMKVLAGRDQDIEDLDAMKVRIDDLDFVRKYLDKLTEKGTKPEQIDEARLLLEALEVQRDHD